jgi:multiple sugar transport system permease protein
MVQLSLPGRGKGLPRARTASREETLAGFGAISPWLIGFVIFTAGPLLASIYFSFTRYDVITPPRWIGLDNYERAFTTDPYFFKALWNSVFYTIVYVPLHVATALGAALLLDRARRGSGVFRTLFYLPSMTPGVATAILWLWILNPNDGLVNRALRFLHLPAPQWTAEPTAMKLAIVIQACWGLGGAMLLFLAGLKNVPVTLYEAAELDGANGWQRFRHVTLPMLSSVTFFVATMSLIAALQVFLPAYVMFGEDGGNRNGTLFYGLLLFREAFQYFHMGYASALAWLLFIVIAALTAFQFYASRRWVYYESEVK